MLRYYKIAVNIIVKDLDNYFIYEKYFNYKRVKRYRWKKYNL